MNNEEMRFRATHFCLLIKQENKWLKEKQEFRGMYAAEAAALEAGLIAGVSFLVSEKSWADFILKELNNVGNERKPIPMLTIVKGCDDHIS